jgi:hypothetical protein
MTRADGELILGGGKGPTLHGRQLLVSPVHVYLRAPS